MARAILYLAAPRISILSGSSDQCKLMSELLKEQLLSLIGESSTFKLRISPAGAYATLLSLISSDIASIVKFNDILSLLSQQVVQPF